MIQRDVRQTGGCKRRTCGTDGLCLFVNRGSLLRSILTQFRHCRGEIAFDQRRIHRQHFRCLAPRGFEVTQIHRIKRNIIEARDIFRINLGELSSLNQSFGEISGLEVCQRQITVSTGIAGELRHKRLGFLDGFVRAAHEKVVHAARSILFALGHPIQLFQG